VAVKKETTKAPSLKKRVAAKKSVAAECNEVKVLNPTELAIKTIVEAIQDKKGKNICSLDLTNIGTSICDHFVICNADSTPAVLAIADNIEEEMIVKCNTKVLRQQGKENAFWIIMDFSDIVVHIFQTEYREFYRLEDLWADAVKTTYEEE
jgi:ribosome-associated protein